MRPEKYTSAEEAMKSIQSGMRVFIHGSAATPIHLIQAMQQRHAELKNVELVSITTLGEVDFDNPLFEKSFFVNSLFVSANTETW
jgi:acyl-CoA hydrolase